jgi:hypothetical protein
MTQFLPPNLLALFAARDPIPYLPPADKLPHEKKTRGYTGVGAFLADFEVKFGSWMFSEFHEVFVFSGSERHATADSGRDKRRTY